GDEQQFARAPQRIAIHHALRHSHAPQIAAGSRWGIELRGRRFRVGAPCCRGDLSGGRVSCRAACLTLPSESVSHNWLYFVVVVAVDKWEASFCFPLIHSLFSSVARRQLAIAAVLRFQSCSNCVGLT